jgi:O-antigen/teichoic acid export membrane protein
VSAGAGALREPADEAPPPAHGIGRASLGTTAAGGVGALLRFGTGALLMTALGRELFGSYLEATTVVMLLGLLASAGVSPGLVPFVAAAERLGGDAPRRLAVRTLAQLFASSAVLSLALHLAAPAIATGLFDEPELGALLRRLAPLVVLGAVGAGTAALLRGLGAPAEQAWLESGLQMGLVLLLVLAVRGLDLDAERYLDAIVLGTGLGALAAVLLVLRRTAAAPGAPSPAIAATGEVLRESVPLLGSALLAFLLMSMDVVFVGALRDPGEVGGYGAAVRLLLAATLVHDAVGQVFVARMGRLFLERDWPGIGLLYRTTTVWSSWSCAGVVLLFVVWAPEVLGVFGEEYAASSTVLVTTRRTRLHLANTVVLLSVNAGLNALWIPEHGAAGAAVATLVSVLVNNVLFVLEGWFLMRLLPFSRRSVAAPLVALALGLAAWPLRGGPGGAHGWLLPAAVTGLVFAALALRFALDARERRALLVALRLAAPEEA